MVRWVNFLSSATNSSSPSTPPAPVLVHNPAAAEPPAAAQVESDFVVILAALFCTLISVVGLISVARCAWLRRRGGSAAAAAANKGLKNKVVQSLPKFTYNSSSSSSGGGAMCAICLAEYVDGDEVRVLPHCGHGFHLQCVDRWLGSHSSCPWCRRILDAARCKKCDIAESELSEQGPMRGNSSS